MNTLALYDVPRQVPRRRLEALLRAQGFVWLFPSARWSSKPLLAHKHLAKRIRARLAGETYRIVLLEMSGASRMEARWLTAAPTDHR